MAGMLSLQGSNGITKISHKKLNKKRNLILIAAGFSCNCLTCFPQVDVILSVAVV